MNALDRVKQLREEERQTKETDWSKSIRGRTAELEAAQAMYADLASVDGLAITHEETPDTLRVKVVVDPYAGPIVVVRGERTSAPLFYRSYTPKVTWTDGEPAVTSYDVAIGVTHHDLGIPLNRANGTTLDPVEDLAQTIAPLYRF